MANEFIAKNGFISNTNVTVKGISGNSTQFLTVTSTGLVTGSGFNSNSFTLNATTNSLTGQLVSLISSASGNAYQQSINYTNSVSGNLIQYINSGSVSMASVAAASANAYNQAVNYTNSVSGNLIQYINSGSVSMASVAAASANALAQANAYTLTSSGNLIQYINTSTSSIAAVAAASANSYQQSINYTNSVSGNLQNNILGLTQSLSGYTPIITTQNLTGALQSQINNINSNIQYLASVTGGFATTSLVASTSAINNSITFSASSNALIQANSYTIIASGNNTTFTSTVSSSLNSRISNLELIPAVTTEPNGFENRTDSTLRWDNSTRTFYISGNYNIWGKGVKYVKSGNSQTIPNTIGNHFFYYNNADGVFTYTTTPWNLLSSVPISYVYWDGTTGVMYEERHGTIMDGMTHYYNHTTRGTQYISGLTINGYIPQQDTINGISFGNGSGVIADEDIIYPITALTSGNNNYNIWYRNGVNGDWIISGGNSIPVLTSNNNLQYNQNTGSTWQLTEMTTNNTFMNYYLGVSCAVSANQQFFLIPGQTFYTTVSEAQAETIASLSFGTIPVQEFLALYQLTFKYANSYSTTTGKSRIEAVARIVGNSLVITAIQPTIFHNSLAGLQGGTAGEYYHLTSSQYSNLIGRPEVVATSAQLITLITQKSNDSSVVHITGNESISGIKTFTNDISAINILQTGYTQFSRTSVPSTPSISGIRIYADSDSGFSRLRTVDELGSVMTLKRDSYLIAKNGTISTIPKGSTVYISGSDVINNKPIIGLAKADNLTTSQCCGVTYENIIPGSFGRIMIFGRIENFNTSSLNAGQSIYVSDVSAGIITSSIPTSINSYVTRLGTCIVSDSISGSIQLRPTVPLSNAYTTYTNVSDASANAYNQSLTNTNFLQAEIINVSGSFNKTLSYDVSGRLQQITTIKGTKVLNYDSSSNLISISGTGIYPTKSFVYSPSGVLLQINII